METGENLLRTKANQNFQEKIEAKKERYAEIADRKQKIADSLSISNVFGEKNTGIPLGQPILVGHHSEKRHRKHLERLQNKVEKGFREAEKASYYSGKAESYGSGGIMSDDPEGIIKLKEKIKGLEDGNNESKRLNEILRKYKTKENFITQASEKLKHEKDDDLIKLLKHVIALESYFAIPPEKISRYYYDTNTAEIRRCKQRLEYMIKEEKRPDFVREFENGIEAKEEDGRINIYFPDKPSEEARKALKSYPFSLKWSPTLGAWTRKKTDSMGNRFFTELEDFLEGL